MKHEIRWLKRHGSFIHYFKTACIIYITDASSRAYKKQLIFYTSENMKDDIFGLQRKISRHDWLLQCCTQLKQLWNYSLWYTIFTRIFHDVWVYYELAQFIFYSKISLSAGKKALTAWKFGESDISLLHTTPYLPKKDYVNLFLVRFP